MGLDTVLIFKDDKLTIVKERKARIMKVKRIVSIFAVLLLCTCLITPISTDAAARVRVRTVKGVTSSYSGRMNYCYVNGKKIKLTKNPIFKKSGSYMGPVAAIFKNSGLKVKVTTKGNKMTLSYGPNTVVLKADSRKAVTNGVKSQMGAPVVHGTYTSTGRRRWIVPLKSVCTRLGINYKLSGGKIRISGTTKSSASNTTAPTTEDRRTETTDSKEKIKIVIDAGHGGSDSGASGNGMAEKNLTLAIVLAAKRSFDNDSRFQVSYTRTADTYPSLSQRANLANNRDADMFLCVHINSASASSARGTETLWSKERNSATAKNGLTSKELATAMQDAAVDVTGFKDRGLVDRPNLYVLRHTKMPACLIEYGFISNKTEAARMKANSIVYGKALYNAVVNLMKKEGRY